MKSQHVVVLGFHIRTGFTWGLSGDVTETDSESVFIEEGANELHPVVFCCYTAAAAAVVVLRPPMRPIRPLWPHCCTVRTVPYSLSHLKNPGWFEI